SANQTTYSRENKTPAKIQKPMSAVPPAPPSPAVNTSCRHSSVQIHRSSQSTNPQVGSPSYSIHVQFVSCLTAGLGPDRWCAVLGHHCRRSLCRNVRSRSTGRDRQRGGDSAQHHGPSVDVSTRNPGRSINVSVRDRGIDNPL